MLSVPAALYLEFTQTGYFVHENESEAVICLELFGVKKPLDIDLLIHVFTTDITATGKGNITCSDRREG